MKDAFVRALDLILPPQALDGGEAPQSAGLSVEAWSRITFLDDPVCDGCGAPFEFQTGARCAACEAEPRAFARARAACLYDDNSSPAILQLKHADRLDHAPLFARWIARAARELVAEAEARTLPAPSRIRLVQTDPADGIDGTAEELLARSEPTVAELVETDQQAGSSRGTRLDELGS